MEAAREKCQVTYKGRCFRINADFSIEMKSSIIQIKKLR
jgi:hypothetical protein